MGVVAAIFSRDMKLNTLPVLFATALLAWAPAHAEPSQGIVMPFKLAGVYSPVLQELITDILVEEGDEVKEGQVVVQLRNDREKLDVELSVKEIELRKFTAMGHEKLFKEKMGSEEKALESKTQYELAQLMKQAKDLALDEKSIRSQLSGVVVKKYKEEGEAVDRSERILDIVNFDQVYMQFYVNPEVRKTLKPDAVMKARVPELDNAEFEGKISFIDPQNNAASGLVRVKLLVDNKDRRIKPGMKAVADFGK